MPKASRATIIGTTAKQSDLAYIRNAKLNADYTNARQWLGYSMMDNAINQMMLYYDGFIMRDSAGNPIGAVSYSRSDGIFTQQQFGSSMISINFIGSSQAQKGVGTSLIKKVAKVAAREGSGLSLSADVTSIGFYNKLGFTSPDGGNNFYMTAAKAKKFARS